MGNLRAARKKRGLSVNELAERVGVSEATISRYETGDREMPVRMARKIAQVLKVKWWKLYN